MIFFMQHLQTGHIDSFISDIRMSHQIFEVKSNEFITFNGSDVLQKLVYPRYNGKENIYNITGNIICRIRLKSFL